jgi:uncharacterized pyridoxamine 5'-phosphate oxidase family protein
LEEWNVSKIVDLLHAAGAFYVATDDGDQPRVRPFGAVMTFEGKTYFCMNNKKNVFKQLQQNPKTEICAILPDKRRVRVAGALVRDDNDAARAAMLEEVPNLKNMYHVGDGLFEVFYLDHATATVYAMDGTAEVITE